MKTKFILSLIIAFLVFSNISRSFAQSPKVLFKAGKDYLEQKKYDEAITNFNKAIELKPDYTEAFANRAIALEANGKLQEASDDYARVIQLDPKDDNAYKQNARIMFIQKKYDDAEKNIDKALELSKKDLPSFHLKMDILLAKDVLDKALETSKKAIEIKETATNFYYQGVILERMKHFAGAEQCQRTCIEIEPKNVNGMVALGRVLFLQNKLDEALRYCSDAIKLDSKVEDAYLTRSQIYKAKLDYPSAINDLSILTVLAPANMSYFLMRGDYYEGFNQYQNAINDYTKVIGVDAKNVYAYSKRAAAYEHIGSFKAAVRDYQTIASFKGESEELKQLLSNASRRLYELNREINPPKISLISPVIRKQGEIEVRGNENSVTLEIQLEDENPIKSININNQPVIPDSSYIYKVVVNVENTDKIIIIATDNYQNTATLAYSVVKTEIEPPIVKVLTPFAAENGDLILENLEPNLFISGKITDASQIKSIFINGATASYVLSDLNPTFNATINVNNKDKVEIKVTDIYNNETVTEYKLNREQAGLLAANPMGKTWVVFIQNSKYNSFASLDGPSKDVLAMKAALAQYDIHNIIVKNDMTKEQLDKYFAIELRDLVKANRVNSLVVWYAGHGKFVNQTGYWIPIDAKREDEYSYFNINQLKASMQSYSETINHVLVISDACESGPAFYQAMREDPIERSCSDVTATRFKSSQVFTSAGYELALDNSQFTKTFANTLSVNANSCIPIETIVSKVNSATKNMKQKPQFGKISGLVDENGTFFFVRKK